MERNDKSWCSASVMRQLALPYSPGVTVYHDEPYTVIGVVRENPSLTLSYGSGLPASGREAWCRC